MGLFLDADEFVTPAFIEEVNSSIKNVHHQGYWLNFLIILWVALRGETLRKLALFRVGAGEYEKIEEENWSYLDMEVHEHPVLKGTIHQCTHQAQRFQEP